MKPFGRTRLLPLLLLLLAPATSHAESLEELQNQIQREMESLNLTKDQIELLEASIDITVWQNEPHNYNNEQEQIEDFRRATGITIITDNETAMPNEFGSGLTTGTLVLLSAIAVDRIIDNNTLLSKSHWIEGYPTDGLDAGDVVNMELPTRSIFKVVGTKSYGTSAGRRTVTHFTYLAIKAELIPDILDK